VARHIAKGPATQSLPLARDRSVRERSGGDSRCGPATDGPRDILNELAAAKARLLSPEQKAKYDGELRAKLAAPATPPPSEAPKAPAEDSIPLDLSIVSPADDLRPAHPKQNRKRHIIVGWVAAGIAFLLLLLGMMFALRTPDETVAVGVNNSDTVVGGPTATKSAAATRAANERHTQEERPSGTDGFHELFNGRDLAGWEWCVRRSRIRDNPFSVKQGGILSCTGRSPGTLRTATRFENYVLRFEWRVLEGASECKCGIFVRMKSAGNYIKSHVGQECTGDLVAVREAALSVRSYYETRKSGHSLWLISHTRNEKPLGEWNTCEIACVASEITVESNGVMVNRLSGIEPWPTRIGFNSAPIELRSIEIKELPHP